MLEFLKKIKKDNIPNPPYDYSLIVELPESEYPKYLKKLYRMYLQKNLNLKNPKTFSEKIQWLKLNDTTPKKTELTDKVKVRDFVKEKIGEQYLKPCLWVGDDYDSIPFDTLPDSFIIKANHGCKWHFIVKNKEKLINNPVLMEILKARLTDWLGLKFYPFAGFEMQYKDITPKLLIEPLLRDDKNEKPQEIEVYCFNGEVKVFQKIKYTFPREVSVFDNNFNHINLKFMPEYSLIQEDIDDNLKLSVELSKKLAEGFKLARVDWLIYHDKIYFNEITFTPFSGFYNFEDKKWDIKLGEMLDLRKD